LVGLDHFATTVFRTQVDRERDVPSRALADGEFIRATLLLILLRGVAMSFIQLGQWQVYDPTGRRKYLSADERRRFLAAADTLPPPTRSLCHFLAYSGCRISEALAVTRQQVDAESGTVILRTLKRRRLVFRAVPVPPSMILHLLNLPAAEGGRLWKMHRCTAWRHVKEAMTSAAIGGPMATCRGLRHGFGIRAAANAVPPSLIAKWLGHASLATTAIYLDAVGPEERAIASRMWD
jgi:integrase